MDLLEILKPEAVKSISTISSKKRLFQEIAEIANTHYGLESSITFDALQDRENLGPTGVGHGVALPHARLESLDQVVGIFVRLEKPLDFDSADKQPVDLFFTLLAPLEAGVDHLKALALVSRTMRDKDTCAKLRANTQASSVYAILTEGPASQAA